MPGLAIPGRTCGGPGTTWGVRRPGPGRTARGRPEVVLDPEGLERRGVGHDPEAREDQQQQDEEGGQESVDVCLDHLGRRHPGLLSVYHPDLMWSGWS